MKKILLSMAALAFVLVFASCGNDKNAPVITLPTDEATPVFDLGDAEAALAGVTANDDVDGDVTANLTVTGLDYAGAATLTYSVVDQANNEGTIGREAIISTGRLGGHYNVSSKDVDDPSADPVTYNVTAAKANDPAKLIISNFYDSDWVLTLDAIAGQASMTNESNPVRVAYGDGQALVYATATYAPTSNPAQYTILVVNYNFRDAVSGEVIATYEDTFELQEK